MTLMLLWQEHGERHPDAVIHSYSQFCENYRQFAKTLKRSMRQIHRAGEKMFIDYAGPTVGLSDGSRAHIFVSALGASGYTFAYATPRETTADWLGATAQALRFYGGCTELIVPDNPKAMIVDPDRYEPRANDTVLDFARHYGTSVLLARPRHPQDKAKAESAVQVVERWILMRLRHQKFETVDEVNEAIAPLLVQLNNKPFQKLQGCRTSVFAEIDAPALRPLPMQTWELAVFKTVKVHIDQHIEFEGHRYSVPHALVGVTLEVRVTQRVVEILHRGQRVASHMRCAHKGGFTTVPEHLSAAHRAHMQWSPERLIHWGQDIGAATGSLVTRILQTRQHLSLQRLRRNQPLTPSDLEELGKMLLQAGGSTELIQQATEQSHGLGIFIRSLVGLDRETAKQAFSQFVVGTTATASQIEFINLIVQYLTENGVMGVARLYESPFIDISQQGPEALFLPIRVTEMVRVLDEIRERTAA